MLSYSQSVFFYTAAIKLADAATVLGIWYGCWYLRFAKQWIPVTKGLPEFSLYSNAALPLVLVFAAMLHIIGAYRSDRIAFGFRAAKKIVEGTILSTLVFVAICYFLGLVHYSRVFLTLFTILTALGLFLERALFHGLWRWWIKNGVRRLRALLVGHGELMQLYVSKIDQRQPYPIEWLGRIGRGTAGSTLSSLPYLGEESNLASVLNQHHPDQVIVSYPENESPAYSRILELLCEELVDVKVLPDFGRYSTFSYVAKEECGVPLLAFNQTAAGSSDRALKRLVDVVGALVFLILFSPFYLLIAMVIKLTSKGPVFFSQERVGADGQHFFIHKFRTMYCDAEATTGPVWAVKDDPRTTAVGKWLRKTSLDETPQFWNVFKGEMSLVGPRPERPEFVAQFRKEIPKYMLRHKMKSGITGWAQIHGWRGNTSLTERIKHDLFYIGHWSHRLDFKILCLTLYKGFIHRHAY